LFISFSHFHSPSPGFIEDIPHIANFFSTKGRLENFVVTGQVDPKTGKGCHVAQLGDTFFVGKGADLVDIARLFTKREYHALAVELFSMGPAKSFTTFMLWNVGWSLQQQGTLNNVSSDLLGFLTRVGTSPVPYPQGITFVDNVVSLTTTRND
jgi:hypothetical protein